VGRRSRTTWLLVALAALVLGLGAGCGGDDDDEGAAGTTAATTTEGGAAEDVSAGLVSDVGRFNDRSFNQSALEGLNRARDDLGVDVRAVESRAAGDYVPNLSTLARQNYDVSIGVGFLLAEAVNAVARRFPDSNFAIIDYSVQAPPFTDATKNVDTPTNVRGLTFATNENSYMIGCLAGLMAERQGGRQIISAVGGIKLPTVDIFIAGYRAGAMKCNPNIRVLVGYSQDFVAQDKCKELALNQIARGSQVIFQVAGGCGLGALDAAKERGKWGIGVDRDQSDLGPHILTSAVKRVDTSVFDTVQAAQEGSFAGGEDATFNLENEGVAVGKISDKVPQEFIDQMNEIGEQIKSGEVTAPSTL
jgi:basic membrane protein A and related proteins